MARSLSSSGLLPLPGSPGSSWAIYKARLQGVFQGADSSVLIAFWLFGLINNVCYVVILSAALDLVGPDVPKGVILLANILPSFLTKLFASYFIQQVPYHLRIIVVSAFLVAGMLLIAITPSVTEEGGSIAWKLCGVGISSWASGVGELSFLGLTHYYGHFSLAAWGSGTGGAGLLGSAFYAFLTTTLGLSIKSSLLSCATLPLVMPVAFFLILPHGPLRRARKGYSTIPQILVEEPNIGSLDAASEALLSPGATAEAYATHSPRPISPSSPAPSFETSSLTANIRRSRALFIPYMLPLLLVYIAEYTINQGITPSLLFPLQSTPFTAYRSFYPFYAFLYQLGVFVSRSSTPFIRLHSLYTPSLLQVLNLAILILHSLFSIFPSIYLIFLVIFWEGLLGGAVYVNTFAEIMENVPDHDREFSLGVTSVSDSAGIFIASLLGMLIEGRLCDWNVSHGRPWCKKLVG